MFDAIIISSIYVLDQDEALDFYVGKLGFEVSGDHDLGFMRWLTVKLPGDDRRHILLQKPGPPAMSEETTAQVRDVLTKGALGLAFVLETKDCRQAYEELEARGVEFVEEPTEQPYGIDCALRDPFGNHIRITQPASQPVEISEDDRQRMSKAAHAAAKAEGRA